MKAFVKAMGLAAFIGATTLLPAASRGEEPGAMRVGIAEGDVQVRIADTGEWVPASVNMPLLEGDELWVPEGGRAAVQTSSRDDVRLRGNTALQVLRAERGSFQFYLPEGGAYVLRFGAGRSALQVDTPDASVRAFGNATFRIDVYGDETDVSALRGSVRAENPAGTTTVRAGSMLALGADGYAELSPLPPSDDWQAWNARRDRIVLARGSSSGYLPEEMWAYSYDFDRNGRWVDVPEYGPCWVPRVAVGGDWAPYRNGRWIWRGGDYVWVGYEPWGWAPYHYGRWAFAPRVGWVWVPPARGDAYWGPGYVGWVRSGEHVAWVPLAPREIYYGHGNYGRDSRNVTNVNVTTIQVTNVYRNVNVVNSVTVVNRTTFVTGRPAPVDRNVERSVREDFARHRNIVVGRPPIAPAATSYAPVIRQVPEAKRPPAAVRKIDARELSKARPLVTEPGRSALRPQEKPRTLEIRKVEKARPAAERARERQRAVPPAQRPGAAPPAPRGSAPVPKEVAPPPARERALPGRPQPPETTAPPPGRERAVPGRPQPPPAPKEKAAPERPQAPPERINREPRGEPERPRERQRVVPAQRPETTAPPPGRERAVPERPQPPPAPKEKAAPERPQAPPERINREPRGEPERPRERQQRVVPAQRPETTAPPPRETAPVPRESAPSPPRERAVPARPQPPPAPKEKAAPENLQAPPERFNREPKEAPAAKEKERPQRPPADRGEDRGEPREERR